MFLIILFRFFLCRCYRCYILNSWFFSIIRPSPPPSPKTLKTTMKREQKLVASMNTCLLWRHKVSRKHFRVFCSPELYYFKEDRAKAVNKSYPQIFFFMIAKSWKRYSFSSINLFSLSSLYRSLKIQSFIFEFTWSSLVI